MKTLAVLLLLTLLTAAVAHSQSVQYEPVAPTTRDAVTLWISGSWAYLCPPDAVNVDRVGHAITVTIVAKQPDCRSGFPVFTSWSGERTIGALEAGAYTVTTRLDTGSSTVGSLEQPQLVVRDVSGPLTVVTADLLPTMTQIRLHTDLALTCPLSSIPCPAVVVRAGNVTATNVNSSVIPNEVIATLPPLQPGTYDVTLTFLGTTEQATAALQVIDPATAPYPQSSSLERILIPLVFSGPGAYGSQWSTEVSVVNGDSVPIDFYRTPFTGSGPLQPGQTRMLTTSVVGQRPNGMLVWVPRAESRSVQFNALVRDLSRQSEALGTELPIVRESEFFHQRFNLLNVPTDSRDRVSLRAYSVGGTYAAIRIFKMGETTSLVEATQLVGEYSGGVDGPSSLVISDLVSRYPALAGAGPLRIEVSRQYEGNFGPSDPGLWAFVSVTNNDTQHVTTISPH